jgi:NAD(P)-dependent dehydrogenase (short-subunit alcohol dehydrogenase family)
MNSSQLLHGKRALVFGAGGTVGAAVAREFAAEGAELFLSGRNKVGVEEVKRSIEEAGGKAHAAAVDGLDETEVQNYVDGVVERARGVDIVLNVIGPKATEYGTAKPALDLTINEYMVALSTVVRSCIITARAAARHMVKQHSGVIIGVTGSPARGHVQGATSIGTAFGAIETFLENLALELGPNGVRVVCLRITANADSHAIRTTARVANVPDEQWSAGLANMNFLKTPMHVVDTAKAAALIASDRFRLLTGTVVNSSAGAAMD